MKLQYYLTWKNTISLTLHLACETRVSQYYVRVISLSYRAAMVVSLCSFRSRRRSGSIDVPKRWSREGQPTWVWRARHRFSFCSHIVVLPQFSFSLVLSRFTLSFFDELLFRPYFAGIFPDRRGLAALMRLGPMGRIRETQTRAAETRHREETGGPEGFLPLAVDRLHADRLACYQRLRLDNTYISVPRFTSSNYHSGARAESACDCRGF